MSAAGANQTMSEGVLPDQSFYRDMLKCTLCDITLQDPVILNCLHSACTKCAVNSTARVACPLCRVTTDTSTRESNLLVSALVNRSLIMKHVFSCSRCIDDGNHDAISVVWCHTCQKSLCADCEKCHNRFNASHKLVCLNEHTVLSELYRPPVRLCTNHGEELKFACFSCNKCRCFKCAHECYTSSHDIQPLDDASAVDRMNDRLVVATHMLAEISSAKSVLHTYVGLPEHIANAREESLIALRAAKKTAIDSITKAYEKAEESLETCWDTLTSKALVLLEFVERLTPRLDWTENYCRVALNTNDIAGLLPQLDVLHSSLRALLHEASQIKRPVEPSKLVRLNICLPCDLDLITSGWFGQTKVASEDLGCCVEDLPAEANTDYYTMKVSTLHEMQQLRDEQKREHEHVERERQSLGQLVSKLKFNEQWLVRPTPLNFDAHQQILLKVTFTCWDVAWTSQGRLLVAAMAEGLKEYDASSFQEITTWKPCVDLIGERKNDYLTTVDALADGRAIVGLYSTKLIVLLHRDADCSEEWQVERRVVELQASPRRLSVWDDQLLAVLGDEYNLSGKQCQAGQILVVVSLNGGCKELNQKKLDYTACSVQLTDRGIVLMSSNLLELTEAVDITLYKRKSYVVDCYSYAGVRLWRHLVNRGLMVMGICLDPIGRVLYAAVRGSVLALSVDDGRELSIAVKITAKEIEEPYAIRLNAPASQMALVTCHSDQPNQIAVFKVV